MEKSDDSHQRIRPSSSSKSSDLEENMRPFKKAKYAWQIKGRGCYNKSSVFYDNKQFANNSSPSFPVQISDESSNINFSSENINFSPIKKHFKIDKVEVISLNPTVEKIQNYNTLSTNEKQLENVECEQCNRSAPEKEKTGDSNSCCKSNQTEETEPELSKMIQLENEATSISVSGSFSPAHMVAQCMDQFLCTLNHTNYSLRKWQTKQIAKGIIDNAINKVLEEMGFIPMPLDSTDSEIASNASGDINCENIENEGVSEAIRQQGLQRRKCCGQLSSKENVTKEMPSGSVSLPIAELNLSEIQTFHHPSAPCTCHIHKQKHASYRVQNCSKILLSNYDKQKNSDDFTFPEETSAQDDLLNAAVSFAISEKGLGILTDSETSYG